MVIKRSAIKECNFYRKIESLLSFQLGVQNSSEEKINNVKNPSKKYSSWVHGAKK